MIKMSFLAASLAFASLGAAVAPASAANGIVVSISPPPPRYEVVPQPRRGQVWVPGHWEWQRQRYAWVRGTFVQARPGHYYNEPRWVQRGDRWAYQSGAWVRGDRDRDGIRNRNDRDRDNDGIANRHDRDRDNDGVPNRYDRNPNNPNRN